MNSYRFRIFVGGNPNIGCCWPMGCRLMGWPMGYWYAWSSSAWCIFCPRPFGHCTIITIYSAATTDMGWCWPMGCRLMGWPMGYWCSSIILISVWTILTSAYYTRHFHSTVHWSMILTFHGRIYYYFCCITIIYDVVYDLVVYAITVKLVIILMSRSTYSRGVRFHVDIWGHCRHGWVHSRQVGWGWRRRGWNWKIKRKKFVKSKYIMETPMDI